MSRIFVLIVLIYTTTCSYGSNCGCTSQTTKCSTSVVDYENITGYDLVSNVLSTQETYLGSAVASRTVTNGYDDVYRLLSEKAVAGSTTTTTSYTYDAANNRSTQEVQVVTGSNTTTTNTTYNYNNLDQVTSTTGALVASFGYDVDGNRTTQTIGSATNTYTYDAENRLVELVQGTGTGNGTYNYAYDYRSRRILRDESAAAGVLTQLVYSGGTSVQEYTTSDSSQSNLQVEFIRGSDYGGGVGGILYSLRGSTASYTHANKRGDITAKTSSSGAITYLSQYQAFGDQVATSGTTQDRQKSNSKEQDPWGGQNEGMRYRDDFGFLTRDPAGMIDGPNEYCYVNQNPWTKFDPEGLATIDDYNADVADQKNKEAAALAKWSQQHPGVKGGSHDPAAGVKAPFEDKILQDKDAITSIENTARYEISNAYFAAEFGNVSATKMYLGVANKIINSDDTDPFYKSQYNDRIAYGIYDAAQSLVALADGAWGLRSLLKSDMAVARLPQDIAVNPKAPPVRSLGRPISDSPTQNAEAQRQIAQWQKEGYTDIRVNQQQVDETGKRVGINRPDLQGTNPRTGQREYIEYDTSDSDRGPGHQTRLQANDPNGKVTLQTVN